jgi:hypothetical protein
MKTNTSQELCEELLLSGSVPDILLIDTAQTLVLFVRATKKVTPWSGNLLEKLIIAQPIKKFFASYEIQKFINVFTKAQ